MRTDEGTQIILSPNIFSLSSLYAVKVLDWALEYKDYKDNLIDQAALMLTLSGRVRETQQVLATQFSFRLKTPNLILKVSTFSQPIQAKLEENTWTQDHLHVRRMCKAGVLTAAQWKPHHSLVTN